ncbi:MAG: YccF domain-containing protein [Tenuifilaceae bacterium]|nr:YccF domain-containing protein [Tenuifilaceae bacterium]
MRTLGNIIWHIPFLGFLTAFWTFIIGGILTLTIVASPIGLGLMQLARFLLTPFSMRMVSRNTLNKKQNKLWKAYGFIVRIFYFPIGLVLAIVTICQIVGLFISIIGIPTAIVLAKSLETYFNPVNKVCVPESCSP